MSDNIEFGGVTIDQSQITYVTYEKDGHTYTITKDAKSSPKVEGFARPPRPQPPVCQVVREDQDPRKSKK